MSYCADHVMMYIHPCKTQIHFINYLKLLGNI